MRHIRTSIVSRHLATRGNNKILRTPPPHSSLTRRTLAQLRTNKSPFLKSYLHKVDAKSHPCLLCPICNTHTHHLFNCTHIIRTTLSPLDLWTDPAGVTALLARWPEKLAGRPQAGTSDSPPLVRVMGVCRQQQHRITTFHYRCNVVEVVSDYVYLGITMNYNNKYEKVMRKQLDQGRKAQFSLLVKAKKLELQIDIQCNLFEKLVFPIMLVKYGGLNLRIFWKYFTGYLFF